MGTNTTPEPISRVNYSCMTNPYSRLFFLHPKRVKMFFKNLKFAKQRITRGYADCDVWELFSWFQTVIPNMLLDLADTHCGYPVLMDDWENKSEEEQVEYWENMLREIAQHIINSDEERCPEKNEYAEEFHNSIRTIHDEKQKCYTVEIDDEISDKMNKRTKEIEAFQQKEISTALDMLKPIFFNLWD